MRGDKLSRQNLVLYACGIIPVVWLALLIAPAIGGGLPNLIENIEPTKSRADVILRKGPDHRIAEVLLRKL